MAALVLILADEVNPLHQVLRLVRPLQGMVSEGSLAVLDSRQGEAALATLHAQTTLRRGQRDVGGLDVAAVLAGASGSVVVADVLHFDLAMSGWGDILNELRGRFAQVLKLLEEVP